MTAASLGLDVTVRRGTCDVRAALQIPAGQIVAVMGPSGAGKSTLLGAIGGTIPLSAGSVRITSADAPTRRSGVVTLGQRALLFPHLTARDNVVFALQAHGMRRRAARIAAVDLLTRFGVGERATHRPTKLSGGEQQRVALARALAARPGALLLDEPLTSLDATTAAGIRTLIRAECGGGRTTVVLVTHDIDDAIALADRLVVIERGQITDDGSVDAVLSKPVGVYAAALAVIAARRGAHAGPQ